LARITKSVFLADEIIRIPVKGEIADSITAFSPQKNAEKCDPQWGRDSL